MGVAIVAPIPREIRMAVSRFRCGTGGRRRHASARRILCTRPQDQKENKQQSTSEFHSILHIEFICSRSGETPQSLHFNQGAWRITFFKPPADALPSCKM